MYSAWFFEELRCGKALQQRCTETEMASVRWPWSSLRMLKLTFKVSSVEHGSYPHDFSISEWNNTAVLQWHNTHLAICHHKQFGCLFCLSWQQRKYQSFPLQALCVGIHWWPVDSTVKGPVMKKGFPCHDFIMGLTDKWQLEFDWHIIEIGTQICHLLWLKVTALRSVLCDGPQVGL